MRYEVATQSDPLRVRQRPTLSAGVLRRLPKGTIVDVVESTNAEGRQWARLADGGWVAAEFLTPTSGGAVTPASGGTEAVIIVPTQGFDAAQFQQVAKEVNSSVYRGRAKVVKTTVSGGSAVTFREGSDSFDWTTVSNLKSVITISHAGLLDGPNLDFGRGDSSNQPWPSAASGSTTTLSAAARLFWASTIGSSLRGTGKIILMGCYMGEDYDNDPSTDNFIYGRAVASATGKTVYAADGSIAAADRGNTLKHIRQIESGKLSSPMRRYNP